MRTATALWAVAGAQLLLGCGAGEREARRARLEAQGEHLAAALDRLEARLLDGRARVRTWEELRERHGRVAAVACEVNARHVADMARLEEEERWRVAGLHAPRLAAVVPPAPALLGRGGGTPLPGAAPPVVVAGEGGVAGAAEEVQAGPGADQAPAEAGGD